MDVGETRGLFTTGRCALSMDWGDIGTLDPGTYRAGQDRRDRSPPAGRKSSIGPPASSSPATRPPARRWSTASTTRRSPSFGGWSGAINAAVDRRSTDAAYAFLSYMSAPEQSNVDVTLGKTGYNPYRTSQF